MLHGISNTATAKSQNKNQKLLLNYFFDIGDNYDYNKIRDVSANSNFIRRSFKYVTSKRFYSFTGAHPSEVGQAGVEYCNTVTALQSLAVLVP